MGMKKSVFWGLMVLAAVSWTTTTATAKPTFQVGGALPAFKLTVPADKAHKEYLGLSGDGMFGVSQIDAEAVIIEIFSMYCPHCQREARKVNDLYELMRKHPKTRGRMKLIGIGTGNSPFEVDIFRQTYDVAFPLFADPDFAIHKLLGEVRTPYFIGIKIGKNGTHEIFYSQLGGFEDAAGFLELMIERSGLK
jgi:peroxiredoxin